MSLSLQYYLFIHMLLYGAFIGITFDLVSALKQELAFKPFKIVMMTFFWITQTLLTYLYIYNVNEGVFHLYIIIFLIGGALIYFRWLRAVFFRDLEILGKNFFIILFFLKKVLNLLVFSPCVFIFKVISGIMEKCIKILRSIFYDPLIKRLKRVKKVSGRVKKTSCRKEKK